GGVLGARTAIEAGIDAVGHAAVAGEEGVPDAVGAAELGSLKHPCRYFASRATRGLSVMRHAKGVLADRSRLEAGQGVELGVGHAERLEQAAHAGAVLIGEALQRRLDRCGIVR